MAGSLFGLLTVVMEALGAHAFHSISPDMVTVLGSGVRLQGWHALALIGCGLFAERHPSAIVNVAGAAFTLGVLLFCGAIYGRALLDISSGPVAPTGGLLLMAGWCLLMISAARA